MKKCEFLKDTTVASFVIDNNCKISATNNAVECRGRTNDCPKQRLKCKVSQSCWKVPS